jgi:hypothetical protein
MGVIEFLRLQNATESILEEASWACRQLTPRAAKTLAIMSLEPQSVFSNQLLRDLLLASKLTTSMSASKDASAVKGELLNQKYVQTEGNVSLFSVTELGLHVASQFHQALEAAIDNLDAPEGLRNLLVRNFNRPSGLPAAAKLDPLPAGLPPKKQPTRSKPIQAQLSLEAN